MTPCYREKEIGEVGEIDEIEEIKGINEKGGNIRKYKKWRRI